MGEVGPYLGSLADVDPISLIEGSDRAESTKAAYRRALAPYLDAGGLLVDVGALQAYAAGLGEARRRHLSSAISAWAKAAEQRIKAAATPETVDVVQATLMRLEAICDAVTVAAAKGYKAHTWLSEAQIAALEASCDDDVVGLRDRVVLGLLVSLGLRRAEAAALTWGDLVGTPDGWSANVTGKGGKMRIVPASDALMALLAEWAQLTGHKGRIARSLGMAQELGESLSPVAIFQIVRRHGEAIGLGELAPHDLRRTFAQRVWEKTGDLLVVQQLLGHASPETTRRYLHVDAQKLRQAAGAVTWGHPAR